MTVREEAVLKARKLVSDEQLIGFLATVWQRHGARDAEYAMARINQGGCLDEFFYTGDECGYYLSAKKMSETTLKIAFGCQDDPLSDEGSEWLVSFTGNEVASVRHEMSWRL